MTEGKMRTALNEIRCVLGEFFSCLLPPEDLDEFLRIFYEFLGRTGVAAAVLKLPFESGRASFSLLLQGGTLLADFWCTDHKPPGQPNPKLMADVGPLRQKVGTIAPYFGTINMRYGQAPDAWAKSHNAVVVKIKKQQHKVRPTAAQAP